ncbi:hypothetical protein T4A_9077 [Trichinella pseudospiralis]|uniref:Uncharacterized protein n=1 Tax=Trichinella pseudospiralis TaxID=6337 RepID=A0A0V1E760_TRIPS|nr:hypothetical protein T4A_9077 [Trichinella pseudospiralis]
MQFFGLILLRGNLLVPNENYFWSTEDDVCVSIKHGSAADIDRAKGILPAENEEENTKLPYKELDMKIRCGYIFIVCCFIVAMPSIKREAERKGKAPANTGSSPNSEGRANSLAEETDEPARGSGSLH